MVFNSTRILLLRKSSLFSSLAFRHNGRTQIRNLASSQYIHRLNFHQIHQIPCEKEKTGLIIRHQNWCLNHHLIKTNSFHTHKALFVSSTNLTRQKVNRSTKNDAEKDQIDAQAGSTPKEDEQPLTLVGKFKKMAKEYWYVLIPVHVVTSAGWIGGFYYASLNGVDIVGILENLHLSETIISKLRDSSLGHLAIAYLLYKIASPARYFVTLGGTTYAINMLSSRGIIKPIPSRDKLVQMYKDKKDDIQQKIEDKKQDIQQKIEQKVADKKEELYQKKQDIQSKIEEKKQDLQQKVADKKHQLEDKLKRN